MGYYIQGFHEACHTCPSLLMSGVALDSGQSQWHLPCFHILHSKESEGHQTNDLNYTSYHIPGAHHMKLSVVRSIVCSIALLVAKQVHEGMKGPHGGPLLRVSMTA